MNRHLVVAVVLCGMAAACAKPPVNHSADTANAVATAPVPGPITLTLADYSIAAPATIPAGYTTFKTVNTSKQLHQAALARLDSGKTLTDFQNAMKSDAPLPHWVVLLGGPQNASDVTLPLSPGNYVWFCAIPGPDGKPHSAMGMMTPMTVTASRTASASPPTADVDVTLRDYQWDLSTPITSGHHVLKVTNAASQPHEMVIVRLADGKSATDVINWAQKPVGPPPALSVDGIASLDSGNVNYVSTDFTPGRYALLCFVPDAKDGKPHVAHGMVREFTVQ